MSAFVAILKADSPLRAVFLDGCAPLLEPEARLAELDYGPGDMREEAVYMLSLKACTPKQREEMARMMSGLGQGSLEEAMTLVKNESALPLRTMHVATVTFSLRHVI